MSHDEIKKAVGEANKPLLEQLGRLERIAAQRTLAFVAVALSLVVAIVSVLYGINREQALQDQVTVNKVVVCAGAKSTALAPRKEPLAGESQNHYLNRLEAQREQLIAVAGLRCPTLPGFATLPYLRAKAILEIESILRRIAPEKLRKALGTPRGASHHRGSSSPGASNDLPSSSATTVDEGGGGGSGSPGRGEHPSGPGPQPSNPQAHPPHHHPSPSGQTEPPPATGGGGGGGGEVSGPPAPAPTETTPTTAPEEPKDQHPALPAQATEKVCGVVGEVKAPALTVCPGH